MIIVSNTMETAELNEIGEMESETIQSPTKNTSSSEEMLDPSYGQPWHQQPHASREEILSDLATDFFVKFSTEVPASCDPSVQRDCFSKHQW